MATVDNLIKYFSEDDNSKIEENKVNYEDNDNKQKRFNYHIKYNFKNEKRNNSDNQKNSKNLKIKDIFGNNISKLNKLKESKKEEINKKDEDKERNKTEKILEDIKEEEEENNNNEQKNKIDKEEILEDNSFIREGANYFKNPKLPGTPELNKKKEQIYDDNNSCKAQIRELKEIENAPLFVETIKAKIEKEENELNSLKDEIIIEEFKNKIGNRKQSFFEEKNDEKEDNTFKEDEDFLEREEIKRIKKEGINAIKERIQGENVEIIEEKIE